MARQLSNWIASYLELVDETEPAQRFHLWTAVTILAACLGRKCMVKLGPETIFPNLYTVLVGPPGVRKGVAISYGISLLEEVGADSVVMGPDVVTREQLFVELEQAQRTDYIDGKPFVHCSLFVVAPELINFIKEDDYERLGYLCKLYDGESQFRYKTKTSGCVYAPNPALWILGATAPNWIEIAMKQLGVGGGMTSRIIFVYSSRKGKHIPLTHLRPFDPVLRSQLVSDLAEIKSMAGLFEFTPEAVEVFAEWYGHGDQRGSRYMDMALDDSRLAGYWQRLPTMVVKVAMVLSAARSSDRIIRPADITRAIRMFEHIHPEMSQAFGGLGYNVLGSQTEMVRNLLREKGRASKSCILRTLRMHISEYDYVRIRASLLAERFCAREFDREAGEEILICLERPREPESSAFSAPTEDT